MKHMSNQELEDHFMELIHDYGHRECQVALAKAHYAVLGEAMPVKTTVEVPGIMFAQRIESANHLYVVMVASGVEDSGHAEIWEDNHLVCNMEFPRLSYATKKMVKSAVHTLVAYRAKKARWHARRKYFAGWEAK